jgi:predicted methyltransferase
VTTTEPLTIRSIACRDCDGWGIHLGPYDPETGRREVRTCPTCDGWGISLVKARRLAAQERREEETAVQTRPGPIDSR